MFFGCRSVGRHGMGKMAVPNGRHSTVRWPTGRAMGRRPGTKPVEARHGRHDGPSRQDPHRACTARWPSITIGGLNIDRLSCHNCRIRAQWHAAHLSCLIAIDILPACLQLIQMEAMQASSSDVTMTCSKMVARKQPVVKCGSDT